MKLKNMLVYIFLFLLTALVLDLANPLFDRPSRDGGFFLYAGQQILDGKIPYQDFWDSKGPAIFYINALGLFLGNDSRWGVWFVEFVFIFLTFFILYQSLKKYWGTNVILLSIAIAGLGLHAVLGNGNYTEEYSLLFNSIGLFLFTSVENDNKKLWKYFLIGTLFGLSFTFRANNIGGLIAIFVVIPIFYLVSKNLKEAIKIIFAMVAGFATPLLLWALYFAWHNTLDEMIYASITFNFSYSAATDRETTYLFNGLIKSGIVWYGRLALFGWLIVTIQSVLQFIRQRTVSIFNLFLLVWFPIEILLSNLSGRNFNHYYISWVLAIAFYTTFIFSFVAESIATFIFPQDWAKKINSFIPLSLIFSIILISPTTFSRYAQTFEHILSSKNTEYIDPISTYIQENTQPDDLILTWYSDTAINFMAERTAPVKYVYYPLFLKDSLISEIENSYINDIATKRPELILDCAREVDAIPSLDSETKKVQFNTPGLKRKMYIHDGMEIIFDFVKANYHIETKIEPCIIFRLNP